MAIFNPATGLSLFYIVSERKLGFFVQALPNQKSGCLHSTFQDYLASAISIYLKRKTGLSDAGKDNVPAHKLRSETASSHFISKLIV